MYGEHSLGGLESQKFWEYWNVIKNKIPVLQGLGNAIKGNWERIKVLRGKTKDPQVVALLNDKLYKWSDMYNTWKEIKARIDKYLPDFMKIERATGSDTSLGIVPFILPVWAITVLATGGLAALAFIATKGLDLIKAYQFEKGVLAKVEQGILSSQEGAAIIEAAKEAPMFGELGALNTGIVVALLGAGGLMLYMRK